MSDQEGTSVDDVNRLNIQMNDRSHRAMGELLQRNPGTNKTGLINYAVQVLNNIDAEVADGAEVVIRRRNGRELILMLVM